LLLTSGLRTLAALAMINRSQQKLALGLTTTTVAARENTHQIECMPTPPVDFSHLSPAERLDLIGELWDSLDPTQAPELTPEIAAELDRRLVEAEQDPRAGRTWDEVRADLRRRIE
jgi:putative addiction module component (TIGR02574 family)